MTHTVSTLIAFAFFVTIPTLTAQPTHAQVGVTKAGSIITIRGTQSDDEVVVTALGPGSLRVERTA